MNTRVVSYVAKMIEPNGTVGTAYIERETQAACEACAWMYKMPYKIYKKTVTTDFTEIEAELRSSAAKQKGEK